MSVVHVVLVLALLGAAVAVRVAGEATVLNFIDYGRVQDRVRLHKWVGNRLLLTTTVTMGIAVAAWLRQDLVVLLLFAQLAVVFAAVVAIVSGAVKFAASPPSHRSAA